MKFRVFKENAEPEVVVEFRLTTDLDGTISLEAKRTDDPGAWWHVATISENGLHRSSALRDNLGLPLDKFRRLKLEEL